MPDEELEIVPAEEKFSGMENNDEESEIIEF